MSSLELHIEETKQSAYAGMLWSHPMITNDPNQQLEVAWLNGFIWTPYEKPCWHCGEPTTWVDLDFEAPLHPGRCSEAKWDEYAWADMMSRVQEFVRRAKAGDLPGPEVAGPDEASQG